MSTQKNTIFYLDLLRCLAAVAVVIIHVLGPWRHLYGLAPETEWLAASSYNAVTRWAVPIFMMITGALLLSDSRPFNCRYYLTRRLSKVAIPFIGWTLIYSLVPTFFSETFDIQPFIENVTASPDEPVWYHLWFFYDFIPLYFVIPLLAPMLAAMGKERVRLVIAGWLLLTLMHWLKVETPLRQNIILYSGYLILGWYLFHNDNNNSRKWWILAGLTAMVVNVFGSWWFSELKQGYSSFFMGYKSLNTVAIAGMIFVLAQKWADNINVTTRQMISLVSKYSLGIYLIHPLLLIPVRQIGNGFYQWFGSNWLAIPALSLLTLICALLVTMVLARIPLLKRLVP
ncbi:Surface polysaccharide O-acyltransferase, integral membrane enzyme [Ferrimonas sediminum]|uniref:Surface polysaccharide O-acyltransferase, integral membrane enzyme n=1 Tax=Ferrimonas sediminum TaxID=718193 RepID=A0A1G8RZ91_9GAMM|nr:acyltransferase family protein [Ferrimonas sediminum]SDJ22276.1 Surface polysaccharide O-acyltransferase, integral membrane enzyme [Ferrimonas sediminum]